MRQYRTALPVGEAVDRIVQRLAGYEKAALLDRYEPAMGRGRVCVLVFQKSFAPGSRPLGLTITLSGLGEGADIHAVASGVGECAGEALLLPGEELEEYVGEALEDLATGPEEEGAP